MSRLDSVWILVLNQTGPKENRYLFATKKHFKKRVFGDANLCFFLFFRLLGDETPVFLWLSGVFKAPMKAKQPKKNTRKKTKPQKNPRKTPEKTLENHQKPS